MSHEVIKRVGARAYRYRVESFRDPVTKRSRSRWTYLGPVAESSGTAEPAPKRRVSPLTRDRLIDAFERLVERASGTTVTAGSVAAEAGVAHGTFYRYFKDKRAILLAAIERVKGDIDRVAPPFTAPFGSREDERRRVRTWVTAVCRHIPERAGVLRAWLEALEADPELRARRFAARRERTRALSDYFEQLAERNLIAVVKAESLATALLALVDAMFRETVANADGADGALADGIVETFDRAIFGVEPGNASPSASVIGAPP
ncbi:MAG: TetR/AcrR family transcriptional regulator [Candidatus Eremiobacteraeota bacterium]|nr:TetR/AcrR family transcriptional regulator [Candidatus Eremiobacteraeota bacterium]